MERNRFLDYVVQFPRAYINCGSLETHFSFQIKCSCGPINFHLINIRVNFSNFFEKVSARVIFEPLISILAPSIRASLISKVSVNSIGVRNVNSIFISLLRSFGISSFSDALPTQLKLSSNSCATGAAEFMNTAVAEPIIIYFLTSFLKYHPFFRNLSMIKGIVALEM